MDSPPHVGLCEECRFAFYLSDLVECDTCESKVCEDCRPSHAKVEDGYDEDVDNDQPDGFF